MGGAVVRDVVHEKAGSGGRDRSLPARLLTRYSVSLGQPIAMGFFLSAVISSTAQ